MTERSYQKDFGDKDFDERGPGARDYRDSRYYSEARRESGRFGRYLSTRSTETWIFFVAGVFLGGFFF